MLFFTLLFCVAISIWKVFDFFVIKLIALDSKIAVPVMAAMITAFITLAATIITQRQTKLREREEAHRQKKIEIYQKFVNLITKLHIPENQRRLIKKPTEDEIIKSLYEYKKDILLWGSANVIKTQLDFQTARPGDKKDILFLANEMYKSIREDIGLSNKGLNNNELIKLFLTNPEELEK